MARPPLAAHGPPSRWKILLAAAILLLMSVGTPISWLDVLGRSQSHPCHPDHCGALFRGCGFCATSSMALARLTPHLDPAHSRAYGTLTIPGVLIGPDRMVDALGPVAALTLVAHLFRHDLPRALRDWALVMALSLYTALGVQAMWLVINSFGTSSALLYSWWLFSFRPWSSRPLP